MFCRNCYPKLVKMTKRGGKAVVFCPAAKFFLRWPSKSVIIIKYSYSMSVLPTTKSAGVLELADETDSKSVGGNTVWVRPPSPAPIVPKWFLPLRYFLFCAAWPDINRRCLPRCLPIFSAPGYPFTAYYDPARTPDSAGKPRQISVWRCTAQCHPPAAVKNRCAAVRSIFENPPCLAARGIFLRCAFSGQALLYFIMRQLACCKNAQRVPQPMPGDSLRLHIFKFPVCGQAASRPCSTRKFRATSFTSRPSTSTW